MAQRKKMSLATLKSFYGNQYLLPSRMRGSPDTRTPATKKNHIHKVGKSFKPVNGLISPAEYRRRSKKRNRIMKERSKNGKK